MSLAEQVAAQGEVVRKLKADKADKKEITAAVNQLLALKKELESAGGAPASAGPSAKPQGKPAAKPAHATPTANTKPKEAAVAGVSLEEQTDLVRKLKAEGADKGKVTSAVQTLLTLRGQVVSNVTEGKTVAEQASIVRKLKENGASIVVVVAAVEKLLALQQSLSGSPVKAVAGGSVDAVVAQRDVVRKLKAAGADKAAVTKEIEKLQQLKGWNSAQADIVRKLKAAGADKAIVSKEIEKLQALKGGNSNHDFSLFSAQADVVRKVKAAGAELDVVTREVEKLQALKRGVSTTSTTPSSTSITSNIDHDHIAAQAEVVKKLKADKADKAVVAKEVEKLLALKQGASKAAPAPTKPAAGKTEKAAPKGTATPAPTTGGSDPISVQAEIVRKLKAEKADKATIAAAVEILLALKKGGVGDQIAAKPAVTKAADKPAAKQLNVKETKTTAVAVQKNSNSTGDVAWCTTVVGIGHASQPTPPGTDACWLPGTAVGHTKYSWEWETAGANSIITPMPRSELHAKGKWGAYVGRSTAADTRINEMSAALQMCIKQANTDAAQLKQIKAENQALHLENRRLRQELAAKFGTAQPLSTTSSTTPTSAKASTSTSYILPQAKTPKEWTSQVVAVCGIMVNSYVLGTQATGYPGTIWLTQAGEQLSKCSDNDLVAASQGKSKDVHPGVARAMSYIFKHFKAPLPSSASKE